MEEGVRRRDTEYEAVSCYMKMMNSDKKNPEGKNCGILKEKALKERGWLL